MTMSSDVEDEAKLLVLLMTSLTLLTANGKSSPRSSALISASQLYFLNQQYSLFVHKGCKSLSFCRNISSGEDSDSSLSPLSLSICHYQFSYLQFNSFIDSNNCNSIILQSIIAIIGHEMMA